MKNQPAALNLLARISIDDRMHIKLIIMNWRRFSRDGGGTIKRLLGRKLLRASLRRQIRPWIPHRDTYVCIHIYIYLFIQIDKDGTKIGGRDEKTQERRGKKTKRARKRRRGTISATRF